MGQILYPVLVGTNELFDEKEEQQRTEQTRENFRIDFIIKLFKTEQTSKSIALLALGNSSVSISSASDILTDSTSTAITFCK